MTAQQIVFALLSALLPIVGVILPGIFKQDKLTQQTNGIIATVIIIIVAAAQAWSEGQLNLINPWLDFGIVLTGISALLSGPFKGVDLYLQGNVGLVGQKQQTAPVTPAQTQMIDLINGFALVLAQHSQAFSALTQSIQQSATQQGQTQPAQAPQVTQQPVAQPVQSVRPASVTPASVPTVQAQSGVQTSIPAFTSTAQYAVVQPNQAQQ